MMFMEAVCGRGKNPTDATFSVGRKEPSNTIVHSFAMTGLIPGQQYWDSRAGRGHLHPAQGSEAVQRSFQGQKPQPLHCVSSHPTPCCL